VTLQTAGPAIDETLVRALPKAEVHVHLEGCFDLADLLELARAAGVAVTVNTDDPAAMGYRLESEWVACADAYGWGLAELAGLARASIAASFAPPDLQAALLADVDRFVADRTRSPNGNPGPADYPARPEGPDPSHDPVPTGDVE
jgi:adenosine deaminase